MTTSSLLFAMLFGSIGFGYFIYGKKQQRFAALLAGLALIIFPYFVSNTYALVVAGLGLMAVPFFLDF
jgi:hypothetical protein